MINLELVFSEIFLSLSIMALLLIGVYKKNSANIIYNLSVVSLVIMLTLNLNLFSSKDVTLFGNGYKIDFMSSFMKLLITISGIFVMLSSSKYLKVTKIFKWLKKKNISDKEMMQTFNCGVGFCIIVSKKNVSKIKKNFSKKYTPYEIGFISKSNKKVNLFNSLRW